MPGSACQASTPAAAQPQQSPARHPRRRHVAIGRGWSGEPVMLSLDSRMFILDGGRKVHMTTAPFRLFLMNTKNCAPCAPKCTGGPGDR